MNRAATQIVTVVLLIVPFAFLGSIGFAFMTSPQRPPAEWLAVAPVSQIPDDGHPARFTLFTARYDGWMRLPDQVAGHVYARRDSTTSETKVLAPLCGPLGAPVDYDPAARCYVSQCIKGARFDLEGIPIVTLGDSNPSQQARMPMLPSTVMDGVVFVLPASR